MIDTIYVHRETYDIRHTEIVADLINHYRYDLKAARDEAKETLELKVLHYVHDDRLTEHEAA